MSRHKTLAELIDAQCAEHADFNVLTMVDIAPDGRLLDEKRSFAQLRDNAARLAVWLQDVGVKSGDRVVLMMNNHPEFVEAMIATALIGATFVPVDPRSIGDKLIYMLNFVESPVVIAGAYALPALTNVAGALTDAREVLVVGAGEGAAKVGGLKVSRYDRDLPGSSERLVRAEPDPASPMFMMFTSGTTGHPKAVVRSHAAHMAGVKGLRALGVQAGDTLFTGLPLSHINAQSTLSAGLSMTLPVVISRKFTKSRLWDICRAYGCTVFTLLGGMIPEIYSVPEQPGDIDNPVRLVIASGMPAAACGATATSSTPAWSRRSCPNRPWSMTSSSMASRPPGRWRARRPWSRPWCCMTAPALMRSNAGASTSCSATKHPRSGRCWPPSRKPFPKSPSSAIASTCSKARRPEDVR